MQYNNFGRFSQNTPQTEPIPGTSQVKNNAGGFSWSVDDHTRLMRFLILGASSSTYYVSQRQLVKENLEVVEKMLKEGHGRDVVTTILDVSKAGRAASNDPALFALARCAAADDIDVRRYALAVIPQIARTGTHLLHFVMYLKQFRKWSRGLRTAIASWFNDMPEKKLAYQLVKYQSRDGYAMRDVLRLSHPKAQTETYNHIYHWVTKGWESVGNEVHPDEGLQLIWAFERAKRIESDKEMAVLIRQYKLPREAVPTQFLTSVKVWEALLDDIPMEAMLRNLATMTRIELIKPLGTETKIIASRLRDAEAIKKSRLHPLKILSALVTYESGKSVKGSNTWTPVGAIVSALNDAFYLSFGNVMPTGKRILLAIDTSASMHRSEVNGIQGMSLHVACGAMAMVIAKTEPQYHVIGVDTHVQELPISPAQCLDDVVRILRQIGGGGTDLSLPMAYALQKKIVVDAFVILSDSETWAGRGHPSQLLNTYRKQVNSEARIVNVQMTSTGVTNNAPEDKLAMESIGFDTATPDLISSFIRGEF